MRSSGLPYLITFGAAMLAIGCSGTQESGDRPPPVIVVGIDGASWNAIRGMWEQGELPNLRDLAERGVAAELKPIAAESPVIWTTIATGVTPERHGITNFVVPSATGDVPVSSRVRKVPAIWNMVSTVERRVAALGWWASWPAEPVHGVVVTDRAVRQAQDAFWPTEFAATFAQIVAKERTSESGSATPLIERQDLAVAAVSKHLASQEFDLLMVYFRNVDAKSHPYWKYFRPQDFARVDPENLERHGDRVAAAYRVVDRNIGELRAAADPQTQFFIISDHGFRAVKREQYRILLDFDRVLEHLGYLRRDGADIDLSRSLAVTWDSAPGMRFRLVKFGLTDREPAGPVPPADLDQLRDRLTTELAEVTYDTGTPAFRVREPRKEERRRGADLTVVIQQNEVSKALVYRGEQISRAISGIHEVTGTHDANTEGIFIAAGPNIDAEASTELVHSLDITPTILYAMALPVAQDFDGRPQTELFRGEFRRRHPVRTIPSWGVRETGSAVASDADEQLMEELRALGYLD